MFYAYNDSNEHEISISAEKKDHEIILYIVDDGKPFDPTQTETPDVSLPAEDRQIGGLGIFLIQKIMDRVEYSRKDNKNILTLSKTI